VFARCPPLTRRPPFDTSQTLLFSKTGKNSGFSKKPGKRRLARSTQFSRNRAPGSHPADDAVPPAFSQDCRPKTETLSLCDIPHVCQWFRCPQRTPLHQQRDLKKEPRTLAGMRNIGPGARAVKRFRRKRGSRTESAD